MKTFLGVQKQIAFALLFFISFSHMTGQGTSSTVTNPQSSGLFNFVSRGDINFSSEQSQKLDNMIGNPIYLSHHFVEVNNLIQVQDDGQVYVNLPDRGESENFVGKNVEYLSPTKYTFYGELEPCDEQRSGYIHLIAENNNVYGQINVDDDIFELQDYGGHKNVLFKIDPTIYTDSECLVPHTPNVKPNTKQNTSTSRSSGCNVRVLVLFTNAANQVGNPRNSANLFVEQTNQAACNSEADITFSLAGVRELEDFIEITDGVGAGVNISNTLDALQTNPQANLLRNQLEADMVILLTDGNWAFPGGREIFGVSYLENWGDPNFAFTVVEIDAAGGRFTFTHELAHNLGCKHNDDDSGAPAFVFAARGHNFSQGCCWPFRPTRRTIMNILNNGSRIMNFSNPDVKYKGKKTGETNSRDNEDQLSAEACTVAAYRTFTPPFGITITGPTFGNLDDGPYTWCLDVTSCLEVEDISWEYSTDGFNYFSTTGNELCWTANLLPDELHFYIRVTVTCSSGETDVAWYHIINTDGNECFSGFTSENETIDDRSIESTNIDLVIFPVPAIERIDLKVSGISSASIDISILDISGKLVHQQSIKNLINNKHSTSVDLSRLQKGYYIISIFDGKEKRSKSIIKI